MREITTVVKMDDQGRVRIPPAVREALGVKTGSSALLEMKIALVEGQQEGNAEAPLATT
jgi:bifunctional DNA-binding transcriptional regulator/antitoxin component of YhaV-PrlF toxin-antitoxin module